MAKRKAAKKVGKKAGKKRPKVGTATGSTREGQGRGRRPPPDLTWELVDELAETVGNGNFRYVACQRAGIHLERFNRWITMGKRDIKLHEKGELEELNMYCHLYMAMEEAEGDAHSEILQDIIRNGDPSTKLKYLQLRYNKLYNKNPNSRINDEDGTVQKVNTKSLLLDMLGSFLDSDDLPPNP